jgi:hypothetical protein
MRKLTVLYDFIWGTKCGGLMQKSVHVQWAPWALSNKKQTNPVAFSPQANLATE